MRRSYRVQGSGFKLISSIISLVLFVVMLGSCKSGIKKEGSANQGNESGIAQFEFSEEIHNFGSLKAGEIVAYTFLFRNNGTKSLIIEKAETDCGCTEVKIPEKVIDPGKEGMIEVIFDSAGEVGNTLKTVKITSNAEKAEMTLIIKANITNELIEIYS
jgi:hypothetical protein